MPEVIFPGPEGRLEGRFAPAPRPRAPVAMILHPHPTSGGTMNNRIVQELYKTRRVSDRTYKRVHGLLGDAAMVELTGLLGYYALVAMTLNVFRMLPPADAELAFAEPRG